MVDTRPYSLVPLLLGVNVRYLKGILKLLSAGYWLAPVDSTGGISSRAGKLAWELVVCEWYHLGCSLVLLSWLPSRYGYCVVLSCGSLIRSVWLSFVL